MIAIQLILLSGIINAQVTFKEKVSAGDPRALINDVLIVFPDQLAQLSKNFQLLSSAQL